LVKQEICFYHFLRNFVVILMYTFDSILTLIWVFLQINVNAPAEYMLL